jgi:hypothetical protein
MDVIQLVLDAFMALAGFPAFLAALINLLKFVKILPDGLAPAVNFWGNVLAFGAVAYFVFSGNLDILGGVDAALGGLAKLIADLLIILGVGFTSMVMAPKWHNGFKSAMLPGIGKSHSRG